MADDNSNDSQRSPVKDVCEEIAPKGVCDFIDQSIQDGGIRVSDDPRIILKPNITFNDGGIGGGLEAQWDIDIN
jgi:hypothetical protein